MSLLLCFAEWIHGTTPPVAVVMGQPVHVRPSAGSVRKSQGHPWCSSGPQAPGVHYISLSPPC